MIILLPNREWNQKQKHEKRLYQSPKTIFDGRDAILRVRTKWLTFNMVSLLWADVKYHVPTGLVFRRRRAVLILLAMPPTSLGRAALGLWCGWFKRAWNQTCRSTNDRCEALASPKGCFFMFFVSEFPVFIHWTTFMALHLLIPHLMRFATFVLTFFQTFHIHMRILRLNL